VPSYFFGVQLILAGKAMSYPILGWRAFIALPLHIARIVSAAALKGHHVAATYPQHENSGAPK